MNTTIQFLVDFDRYSKSPIVIKNCYEKEILDYTDTILSKEERQDNELYQEFSEYIDKEKQKKSFKDML